MGRMIYLNKGARVYNEKKEWISILSRVITTLECQVQNKFTSVQPQFYRSLAIKTTRCKYYESMVCYQLKTARKERRSRLEIYYDILNAIKQEAGDVSIKPTKVQYPSNLSYDKLTNYFAQLEKKKMISRNPLSLTDRGHKFLLDFDRIKKFLDEMGIEYLRDVV